MFYIFSKFLRRRYRFKSQHVKTIEIILSVARFHFIYYFGETLCKNAVRTCDRIIINKSKYAQLYIYT